jgi:2-polyprenyl-3-methyl-5-hydroxy-6-metoxy-1,4-benzoquinol methylase
MREFEFREVDQEGQDTLKTIAKADKFNKWMFETILPFCSGNILEIGSGIGNISRFFLESGLKITLSDIRKHYCAALEQKFSKSSTLEEVLLIDLSVRDFEKKYSKYNEAYDTVFALNVVEHISDHNLAIQNGRFLLKKGGNLIILVPAFQELYNNFDVELGHYRRYRKNTLKKLFLKNGFEIIHSQYFNLIGILGWYISGRLLRKKTIPEGQMDLYNTLVPVFRVIDKLTLDILGLSVIAVGRK